MKFIWRMICMIIILSCLALRAHCQSNTLTYPMSFTSAKIQDVVGYFAQISRWHVIVDPSLTGNITIVCPKPVTIEQAFGLLQSSLEIRGFTALVETQGKFKIVKILPINSATKSTKIIMQGDGTNQIVTQVIYIQNADAKTIAQELTPLVSKGGSIIGTSEANTIIVTDTIQSIRRIEAIVESLSRAPNNYLIKVVPLIYNDATHVAEVISSLFRQSDGVNSNTASLPQTTTPQRLQQPQNNVSVVAHADTNSVIVLALKSQLKQVEWVINALDAKGLTPQVKIINVKYASSSELCATLTSVLASEISPKNTMVISYDSLNSIIVVSTEDNIKRVEALILELDVNVPTTSNAFIINPKNAQASNIADILSQFFGGYTTRSTSTSRQNTTTQRRQGNNTQGNQNRNNP